MRILGDFPEDSVVTSRVVSTGTVEIEFAAFGEARVNPPILVSVRARRNPDRRLMSGKKRHTVTTIETHEFWIVRRPERPEVLCPACPDVSAMLTSEAAAEQAGVSQRTVLRWVDEGVIHFAETAEGKLWVCLAPLTLDAG